MTVMTTQDSIKPLVDGILNNPLQFKKASMKTEATLGGGLAGAYGNDSKSAPYIVIGNKRRFLGETGVEQEGSEAEAGEEVATSASAGERPGRTVPKSMAEALKLYSMGEPRTADGGRRDDSENDGVESGRTGDEEAGSGEESSSGESEEFHEAKEFLGSEEDVGTPLGGGSGSDDGEEDVGTALEAASGTEDSGDEEYMGAEPSASSSDGVSHVSEDERLQLQQEAREAEQGDEELKHKARSPQRSITPPVEMDDMSRFYQLDENINDRGTSSPSRIVKNWGSYLAVLKPRGLLNHGVTCYTNAAVQAMLHIPAIQHYLFDILRGNYADTIDADSVSYVLAETSRKMWLPQDKSKKKSSYYFINPKKLIARLDDINCMMSEWQQEDSHEYFMSLMSRLQEDSVPKGHKMTESIIYDIFGGLLKQSVTCKSCGHISKTEQPFYDLSLHLKGKKSVPSSLGSETPASAPSPGDESMHDTVSNGRRFSIEKSIRDFFNSELIKVDKEQKGYVCEHCQKTTNASKHNSILRAPETLLVHLKKFRFNGTSSSKMKQAVSYPMFLDLTEFCQDKTLPVRYQLINVVVHEGRSLSSGHYIVHCRQPDGSWATYDDEYINRITERDVLKEANAYYLLYTRLTPKETSSNGLKPNSNPISADDLKIPMINNASTPSSSPIINRKKKWKKNKRKRLNH